MNKDETFKLPRLYTTEALAAETLIPLEAGQAHYLHNVLRRKEGDLIRLFNGKDGEWLACLRDLAKKGGNAQLTERLSPQPTLRRRVHLLFTPIKKHRMDWMIEKIVELGVTNLHPVLTQNTEVRKINAERIEAQIFEATEQCERFIIPTLHPLEALDKKLAAWPPHELGGERKDIKVLACLERYDAPHIHKSGIAKNEDVAFLIGPEGGFTAEEKDKIAETCKAVTLGTTVLRCETAAIKALILLNA